MVTVKVKLTGAVVVSSTVSGVTEHTIPRAGEGRNGSEERTDKNQFHFHRTCWFAGPLDLSFKVTTPGVMGLIVFDSDNGRTSF